MSTLVLERDVKSREVTDYESVEGFNHIVNSLGDNERNWEEKTTSRTLIPRACNIEEGRTYHQNYMGYLATAWNRHRSIVVDPNYIWYMVLCELTSIVKGDPEAYRDIFTESDEKQLIIVRDVTGGYIMPLDKLIAELRNYVPTEIDTFLPELSTATLRSRSACRAAFCDMASPYYDYKMLACAFPAIDVRGTRDDWTALCNCMEQIGKMFTPVVQYCRRVHKCLTEIAGNLKTPEFWKKMFVAEQCGSGSEILIKGWITDLYFNPPDFAKPCNFSEHTSIVPYRRENWHNPDDITNWEMKHGLFFSREEGEFLAPDFGYVLFQKLDEPEVREYKMEIVSYRSGEARQPPKRVAITPW